MKNDTTLRGTDRHADIVDIAIADVTSGPHAAAELPSDIWPFAPVAFTSRHPSELVKAPQAKSRPGDVVVVQIWNEQRIRSPNHRLESRCPDP